MTSLQSSSGAENLLLEYGILGLAVLVLGWFAIFMFRRLIKEIDELRQQREVMISTLLETVPLIKQSNSIHLIRQKADEDTQRELGELRRAIEDARRECRERVR